VFGAANAYLGLRVGLTVSTSIPIAVLTVALFRASPARGRGDPRGEPLADDRLRQLVAGLGHDLHDPRPLPVGLRPPLWQVAILAFLGGVLGISAMIPLRRLLIVRSADELPYPRAPPARRCCARPRPTRAAAVDLLGLAVGAGVKLALGAAC
jgi:hypothetical protein